MNYVHAYDMLDEAAVAATGTPDQYPTEEYPAQLRRLCLMVHSQYASRYLSPPSV
jgi:hypothetical protein